MISIVDYGLGNVQAFANIYKRLNIPVTVARSAEDLRNADKVILPGVGAFDWAMTRLNDSGMRDTLESLVAAGRSQVLGVCVGMQMMARSSEEGTLEGLGWIDAEVRKFSIATPDGRLPHMGWNDVAPRVGDGLFRELGTGAQFYFLHSYYVAPRNAGVVLAVTDYQQTFASSVGARNVYGVQFHPEKSHRWGIQLLRNFAELRSC